MLTIRNYVRAKSLEEAYRLNQSRRSRVIGGMLWLRMQRSSIDTAIDLCDLGLDTIDETADTFSIGTMVTLRQLEQHHELNRYTCNAVKAAVESIVGVQFRNMATVGGSIWGRFGFSDILSVFLAMDCFVELYHGGIVSLEEFSFMKYDKDLLVRLIVKKTPGRFVYTSMRNQRTDFPVITCAVSEINGEYRAVIGARPGRAMILRDELGLLAKGIHEESAAAFADFVAGNAPTGSNLRAGAEYRTHLIRVLTQRAILQLGGA